MVLKPGDTHLSEAIDGCKLFLRLPFVSFDGVLSFHALRLELRSFLEVFAWFGQSDPWWSKKVIRQTKSIKLQNTGRNVVQFWTRKTVAGDIQSGCLRLHFDTSGSARIMSRHNAWECTTFKWSRGIKMLSVKVAIQLHWFPWSPRYEKRVCTITRAHWAGFSNFSLVLDNTMTCCFFCRGVSVRIVEHTTILCTANRRVSPNVVTMETSAIGWPPWLIRFDYLWIWRVTKNFNARACAIVQRSRGIKM